MPGDSLLISRFTNSLPPRDSITPWGNCRPQLAQTGDAGIVGFAIFVFVVLGFIANAQWKHFLQKRAYRTERSNFPQYNEWLINYNAYYKSLPGDFKQRFMERVAWFISSKTFNCVDLPREDKMPLLISAAAVQLTFGLDKYMLGFFDTIYIMRHNYNYGMYSVPFEGHVSSNGIYLSWDNFLKGFANYTDGDNVGIHEMAHALAYVNFMAGANDGQDENFIKRFYNFSIVGRPIFNDMQNGNVNLLNKYAATNYNEFWAVAVETFFEKSLQMKTEMPDLYIALCSLLNQDPLLPEKLLSIPV